MSNKAPEPTSSIFGIYDQTNSERRNSKTGISMLKFNPKNAYTYSQDEKSETGSYTQPNTMLNGGGLTSFDGGSLSGGGLTKLGKHNF